jgi:hypothetical protein
MILLFLVVKLFRVEAYNNFDDFQHMNFNSEMNFCGNMKFQNRNLTLV